MKKYKMDLTTEKLIDYHLGNLSYGESQDIKEYILLYPYYVDILSGIESLLREHGSKEKVIAHLEMKKREAAEKLGFDKK